MKKIAEMKAKKEKGGWAVGFQMGKGFFLMWAKRPTLAEAVKAFQLGDVKMTSDCL